MTDGPPAPKMRRNIARCEACGTVVESVHLWDSAACACGALVVSGGPLRPYRSWLVVGGGGWTDLSEYDHDDGEPGGGRDEEPTP